MCNQSSPYTPEPSLQAQLCSPNLLWHQVSQYLSPPSLGWMTSCAANGPLKYTLERHGSEKIPFPKERNLAKDAVVPGKQKPAVIWLSSLAPHRVVSCKTKKIPPPHPEGKVLLGKSKAREPLREDFITTAVCLTICLPTLPYGFHPGW